MFTKSQLQVLLTLDDILYVLFLALAGGREVSVNLPNLIPLFPDWLQAPLNQAKYMWK